MERRSRRSLAWRIGLSILSVEGVVLAILGFAYTTWFAEAVDARVDVLAMLPCSLFNAGFLGFETISDPSTMQQVVG